MIVRGERGEARFDRERPNGIADQVELGATCKSVIAHRETTEQTNKSRAKERGANSDTCGARPFRDQIEPKKWQDKKIGPDQHLHVVLPFLWSDLIAKWP